MARPELQVIPKALQGEACGPAGALRHKVRLQAETRAGDSQGGDVLTWTDVATMPARVIPVTGRERMFAHRLEASVTHFVYARYRAGVTAKHRLLFGTRPLNIRAAINLEERNEWLEMQAEEGVAS